MTKIKEEKMWDARFISTLKTLAPGNPLRDGIDNILRGKMGALVVVDDSPSVIELVDGGFNINCEYTPAAFYELAKMDGALILSGDSKKILCANTQLIPDQTIATTETGTRHRTAERVARQTGAPVIAISQRRNIITLYLGNLKYVLKEIPSILSTANQALQTLEKYDRVLNKGLITLSALEFEDLVTLSDVASLLIKAETVRRIAEEIAQNIIELGSEGRLINMQMEELMSKEDIIGLLIKDYSSSVDNKCHNLIREQLASLTDDNMELINISRLLGYNVNQNVTDVPVVPRGYRMLGKISKLPSLVIDNLVNHFKAFPRIYNASIEELDEVEGIGEVRAKAIKEGFKIAREQVYLDRYI